MKNQEQLVKDNQRAVYKQQMKQNLEMLEPEARFWEAQFKALYYKNEFAKLQAEITQQMQLAQQEMVKNDSPTPVEVNEEMPVENIN